jgi:hypothetical protein
MALACNIDARGKAARFRIGLVLLALAAVIALSWAVPARSTAGFLVTAALALAGGFSLFEARAGWCAVRAMGLRTRI